MSKSTARNAQLAAIHCAKRDLGMDDETYRTMLWTVARVRSAGDLDQAGRHQVLDHLRRVGARRTSGSRRAGAYPGKPHNANVEPMLRKIEAQLADMGLPWSYADSIARHMFRTPRIAWVRGVDQLSAVIAALHVEQEKRQLLAAIDEQLVELGRNRAWLATQFRMPRRWTRSLRWLRHLSPWLGQRLQEKTHA